MTQHDDLKAARAVAEKMLRDPGVDVTFTEKGAIKLLLSRLAELESALQVAETWMAEAVENCEANSETVMLPRGYPSGLKTVRKALTHLAGDRS